MTTGTAPSVMPPTLMVETWTSRAFAAMQKPTRFCTPT